MGAMWFFIGMCIGVLATVPVAWFATRRTERRVRLLERRARAAERLAELGTLTSGLAHEIKNPLSTVGLNIQLMQEDLEQENDDQMLGRVKRRLESLNRETQRLKDILEDFLQFAGRIKLDLAVTDVNAMIDELVDFFAPQADAAKIHLRSQLAAKPPTCPIDAPLLKQALLNLLINASHAMTQAREKNQPHGGADELLIRTERTNKDFIIHVTDTGPGIPQDVMPKIFQPYFSTRRGGTGLGLPTTQRIVEEHGGVIICHSEVGRGTEFNIRLPLEAQPPESGQS